MSFLHRLFARLHPPLPLCQLPCALSQISEITLAVQNQRETNTHLGCTEVGATWADEPVTLFIRDDLIVGMRFDLSRRYGFLKALLLRSAKVRVNCLPQHLLDREPTYVGKLTENMITISGYTGSIGVWTKEIWTRMRAPKPDPIEETYKGTTGYLGHWTIRDDEVLGSGVLEVYLKHDTTEVLLGRSNVLESFALELVLINLESSGSMKLLKDGKQVGEIPLAGFSLPTEHGWHTQGAVYRSGDLYVLWHTSVVDFRNALGYKLVK